MKTALITGARGFVGRHLAHRLHARGVRVLGIGHGAWTEAERAHWGVDDWLNGEVSKRNLDIVQSSMASPDVIFHLAGGSSVGPSFLAPEEDFRRSVMSAAELLEWARLAAPSARLVLASSAAVYGAGHHAPIDEAAPLAPYSPYGFHKRISEQLFESYARNFGLSTSIVRLFSVYGPELKKQLLWDACCRLASAPQQLRLGGSGAEVRDWLHVSDAAVLLELAAEHAGREALTINGGSGVAVTVREVAAQLCRAWGEQTELEFSGQSRHGDPQYLVARVEQAARLGFVAATAWQDGITDFVAQFKRQAARGNA